MTPEQITMYVVVGVFIVGMLSIIITFPYLGLVINRWKLFIMGRTGKTPVVIKYRNKRLVEIVVDTGKESFEYEEERYNIRKEAFHTFNRLQYLFYEQGNPEPILFQSDEEKDLFAKMPNGSIEKMRGKVVDAKLYDQTCSQFYYAGIAFANRNKNKMMIILLIIAAVVIISAALLYWKMGKVDMTCRVIGYNITNVISSLNTPAVAIGVPGGV